MLNEKKKLIIKEFVHLHLKSLKTYNKLEKIQLIVCKGISRILCLETVQAENLTQYSFEPFQLNIWTVNSITGDIFAVVKTGHWLSQVW